MKLSGKYVCLFVFLLFAWFSHAQTNKTLDSLNLVLKNAKHDTTRVEVLIEISELNDLQFDTILNYSYRALSIIEKNLMKDKKSFHLFLNYQASIFNSMAVLYYYKNNNIMALQFVKKALKISQSENNKKSIAASLINLGYIYYQIGSPNLDNSIQSSLKALRIYTLIKDKNGIATSYKSLGFYYDMQGKSKAALNYYYKSLKISEMINDTIQIAYNLNSIGRIFEVQSDFNKSLEYYKKALELLEKIKSNNGISSVLLNISSIYRELGDTLKALKYNLQVLTKAEVDDDKSAYVSALINIGVIYNEQGHFDKGLSYFFKSFEVANQKKMWHDNVSSLIWIGSTYFSKKEYNLSEKYSLQAFNIAQKHNEPEYILYTSQELAKVYKVQGKYKEAYQMHVLFKQMADSVKNDETHKAVVKNQLQYEYEKQALQLKQKQTEEKTAIELANQAALQRKNYWIYGSSGIATFLGFFGILFYRNYKQKQKNTLQQNIILEQKLLRSQMNPHFIFNSLGMIQSYIRNNKSERAEEYLIKFSKLMRLILENSREEYVPLEKEIETLTYYLNLHQLVLQNGFSYQIHVDDTIDTGITCIPPMLAQPFIENALKHGLADKKEGELSINFKNKNGLILFEVIDNGIGYSRSQELKIEETIKHKSLATQIVYERLENINKNKNKKIQIKISDIVNSLQQITGTKVQFEIPAVYDN